MAQTSESRPEKLIAGDQTLWIDVSSFFSDVCNDLEVGQLIHGENFSLFEAMSALEIMDPKMDAGMAGGANTLEEAIEKGAAPIKLSVLEVIDVIDHLLACEATWHCGHSLAQTVFSCLYMLNLDRTSPNALLHAYCRTTRAACSLIRAAVYTIHSNEEEELFTLAFGLPLEGEGDGKCLSGLHSVEEVVARQLKGSRGMQLKKKASEEIESLQEDPSLEEGYCQALLSRIRFRKALYHVVTNMNKPQGRGLELARKHITAALSEIKNVEQSSDFLSRCVGDEGILKPKRTTASGREPIGFDAKVNRRITAPTPPRSISIVTFEETIKYFSKLLEDLDIICSLSTNLSLEELLQTIVDFQKRDPGLVARTFLQILLAQDGKFFGRDNMSDMLYHTFMLPESVKNKTFESDSFIDKSGQLTLCLVRVLCTNMAWQHRKLGKVLAEWGLLLQQADSIFDHLMQKTLAPLEDKEWWENIIMGWTAEQTCWISMHILMLGFQLQLYAPSEYCMVYWYLEHIMLTELHYKQLKERKHTTNSDVSDIAKRKKKNKKKGSLKTMEEELRPTPRLLLLQCYVDLCKALSWMMAALVADRKIIHDRPVIFNTDQERFVQRFDLFQKVPIPQPLSYFHYKEFIRQKSISIKEQYYWSTHYFMTMQQHVQELSHYLTKSPNMTSLSRSQRTVEVNQLKQVASRNLVVLKIIDKSEPGDNIRVSFDFSQHPCFAVGSVKQHS